MKEGGLIYPAGLVKEGLEQVVIVPHLGGFHAELNLGFARHADPHDLVEIVASGLSRGDWVDVKDGDV